MAWRGDRSPADVGAWIIAGKEAKMGVVTDIKQALRAANILRVTYNGAGQILPCVCCRLSRLVPRA